MHDPNEEFITLFNSLHLEGVYNNATALATFLRLQLFWINSLWDALFSDTVWHTAPSCRVMSNRPWASLIHFCLVGNSLIIILFFHINSTLTWLHFMSVILISTLYAFLEVCSLCVCKCYTNETLRLYTELGMLYLNQVLPKKLEMVWLLHVASFYQDQIQNKSCQ